MQFKEIVAVYSENYKNLKKYVKLSLCLIN
jgi:hypothetical protein